MTRAVRGRRQERSRNPRRRRFPVGLFQLAVLGGLIFGALRYAERLEIRADDAGLGWIDPSVLAELQFPDWADQRWQGEFAELVSSFEPFYLDDQATIDELLLAVDALSFVEHVETLRTIWPNDLELDFSLRRPVGCVAIPLRMALGDEPAILGYRTVDADGVLLSGLWRRPPSMESGWLPLVGSPEDQAMLAALAETEPGDWLAEPEHLAALDVAVSMADFLTLEECARLGRIVIDASHADYASVENPGVRLDLEHRRRVLFGGAPSAQTPGELSPKDKWRHLARGLDAFDDPSRDWDVLDVRWDVPELLLRNRRLAQDIGDAAGAKPLQRAAEPRRSVIRQAVSNGQAVRNGQTVSNSQTGSIRQAGSATRARVL